MWSILLSIFTVLSIIYTTNTHYVSFKNVCVLGSKNNDQKFNITINSSNNLKENLPNLEDVDKIKIKNAIPILYANSITDIDHVEEIFMNYNNLNEIRPGAFKNLPKLNRISLVDNELKEIKKGVFSDLTLEILDLGYNQIETIEEGAFSNMPKLADIRLIRNKLKCWNQNWFENTPNLVTIYMADNEIEEIPAEAFKNFEQQSNTIPATLELYFSQNKIEKIDENAFKHLKNINTVDLAENEIKNFNINWFNGINVDTLDVSSNKMNFLRGDFDKIFSAKLTKIDENPWTCDVIQNLKNYMKDHPDKIDIEIRPRTCEI